MIQTVPYVYRITDTVTGKRYIGARYGLGCAPEDLGVSYFTSSRAVRPLFKSDPARFEKQIIVTGDRDYVINVERELLELYDAVMSEEFYNRTNKKAVHPDDIARGVAKTNSVKDAKGRSAAAVLGGVRGGANGSFENRSRAGKLGGAVSGPGNVERLALIASAAGKIGGFETCKPRFRCLTCGLETNRGNVARHRTAKNHIEWEPVVK